MTRPNIAPVPEPPKQKRELTAEAKFRLAFREIVNKLTTATFRERAQLREDAHRIVNAYFDARIGRRS